MNPGEGLAGSTGGGFRGSGSAPLRIAMVTSSLNRVGGVETHVREGAAALAEAGHEIALFAGEVDDLGSADGVRGIADLNGAPMAPSARAALRRGFEGFRPEVVHVHSLRDAAAAFAAAPEAATVMSVHAYTGCMTGMKYFRGGNHCTKPHGPLCLTNVAIRGCGHARLPVPSLRKYRLTGVQLRTAQRADACIVYSAHMRGHMLRNGVLEPQLVPLFVEPPPAVVPPPGARRVLFSGRVVPYKGADVAVRAMARVPEATLQICGDGWGMGAIVKEVERLGLRDRVEYLGWRSPGQLDDLYRQADVVVVPSVWPEPFGLVGVEAMAHARATVASDGGGVREWLVPGETGWLFAPGSDAELGERLCEALADPARLARAGEMGRRRVEERFSVACFRRRSEEIYRSLVIR